MTDLELVADAAIGVSPANWCRQNETAPAKATKCQSKPEYQEDVRKASSRLLDRAVGKFTGALKSVTDAMIKVASSALSQTTQLAAQRSFMQNLIKIAEFADLTRRINEWEPRAGKG